MRLHDTSLVDEILVINNTRASMSMGRYTKQILSSFEERAKALTITYSKFFSDSEVLGKKITGLTIPFMGGWEINKRFQGLIYRNKIKKERVENSLVHYTSNLVYPFIRDSKCIVTIPDLIMLKEEFRDTEPNSFVLRYLRAYSKFENVLCYTDYVKQDLIRQGFDGKISVIPLSAAEYFKPLHDKHDLRVKLNLPQDKILILSIALNIKRKNLKLVQSVVEHLGEDFRLVRVGTPLGNSITFPSGVDDETLNMIYNACDLLFFPSLEEGFGYPIVEAFASGLPVVASDIPVFQEIGKGGAILVQPTLAASIEGVKEAINNKEEFISKGLDQSKRFTMEKFTENMLNFYNKI